MTVGIYSPTKEVSMLTRLLTGALLFLCALSLTQFTATAETLLAPGDSDVLVIQVRNSPGLFTTVFRFALPEAASESGSFAFTPMPIVFPEPGTNNLPSDMISFSGPISGTITSDTANGPPDPNLREGPFSVFSIVLNLANDMGATMFGPRLDQTFSFPLPTEAAEINNPTLTVNVPQIRRMIAGDRIMIDPFSFTFSSFATEPAGGTEETFSGTVFRVAFESDLDAAVPEPAVLAPVGSGLLLLGIFDLRRRRRFPLHSALTSSKNA
jgi:hypothetical protein